MSAQSYRNATAPWVLQRWHTLLSRSPAVGDGPVGTVSDEIADALDHTTNWAPMADPVEVDGPVDEANGAFLSRCALCPRETAPVSYGENEHVARGALGEHTERAHGRPPWPTTMTRG